MSRLFSGGPGQHFVVPARLERYERPARGRCRTGRRWRRGSRPGGRARRRALRPALPAGSPPGAQRRRRAGPRPGDVPPRGRRARADPDGRGGGAVAGPRARERPARPWRREAVRRRAPPPAAGAADPEPAFLARDAVWRALDRLSTRRRAVVVLHELDDQPVAAIAALLGLSRVTVRWHLAAARRELARALTQKERPT